TKALNIDLRENAGGGKAGSTPLLESYLFDRRTHLSDVSFRYTGEIRKRWTLDSVTGARFGGEKPVVLLTSAHTLSAAEELAYDLQALKRATVVGETTSGQAHATFEARIDNHFEILLPTGKALNPVTGTDWEGVGVVPDVKGHASERASYGAETAPRQAAALAPPFALEPYGRSLRTPATVPLHSRDGSTFRGW